jgi:hypothetical protein
MSGWLPVLLIRESLQQPANSGSLTTLNRLKSPAKPRLSSPRTAMNSYVGKIQKKKMVLISSVSAPYQQVG